MKLVKIVSPQFALVNGCEHFQFNEFGEFENWREQEAWFVSREDALETLLKCGMDEFSISLLEFREFDYIPPLSDSNAVLPCAAIYCNGIGFTTKGDDVSIVVERLDDALNQLKVIIGKEV